MRQTYSSWLIHVPIDYGYYLYMPDHVQSPYAHDCLTEDLEQFRSSLEEWTANAISNQALDKSIETYNTNRHLMRKVYELRKTDRPPVSGTEAIEMVLSSMLMDKDEHNLLLKQALAEMPKEGDGELDRIRLMVIGSEADVEFLRLVEKIGGDIVADDLCTGSRYFWNDIIPEEDRLSSIATRYLNKPPCPNRDLIERRRLSYILKMINDYRVQGVIIGQQKFCEMHALDIPTIESMLKENNIPSLHLEFDVTIPVGQLRTRIEAFLEMLQLEIM